MDNLEITVVPTLLVREPEIFYPLGWEKDGQAKRRERRKNRVKDNSRWHMVKKQHPKATRL